MMKEKFIENLMGNYIYWGNNIGFGRLRCTQPTDIPGGGIPLSVLAMLPCWFGDYSEMRPMQKKTLQVIMFLHTFAQRLSQEGRLRPYLNFMFLGVVTQLYYLCAALPSGSACAPFPWVNTNHYIMHVSLPLRMPLS